MPEIEQLIIPDFVQNIIEPIEGGSACGADAGTGDEFFRLNMEIPKTVPDYKKCIELSLIILKEKSKDIKVAAWLCFSLFRVEKLSGLLNGLKIIYLLLKKYENDLYPKDPVYRSKAIQFLNTQRFFKLVEKEVVDPSNAKEFIEAELVLKAIVSECAKLFPENPPVLKSLLEVMKAQTETAKKILSGPAVKPDKPFEVKPPEIKPPEIKNTEFSTPPPEKPVLPPPAKESSSEPIKPGNENDGIIQLRRILTLFYETQLDGVKKEKVPESFFVFGMARELQWGKLIRPQETSGVTQLDPPNSIIKGNIVKWFETSDWDTLIPRIEINFLKADSVFPYWFDAQRYLAVALDKKGGSMKIASEEIKRQLSVLLNRIPDLYTLKFKDKTTPLADDETVKWICNEVLPLSNKSDIKDQTILPPVMGEDYDSINIDYNQACSELPKNIEKYIAVMQKAIDSDDRIKGKFLRRLNLSNYCLRAKLFELAKVHLDELIKFIDEYSLALWEPALCTAVWQSSFLVNKDLASGLHDKEAKILIDKEQKELFTKIAKYNSLMAIKLKQIK